MSNPNPKKVIKYVRKVPVVSNVYQPKIINNNANYIYNNKINTPFNNNINQINYVTQKPNYINNITPIKDKNSSIINQNHFKEIQRINQTNPYNINSVYSSYSNLNRSYSSLSSNSSNKPRKYDKLGNPIYSVSLHSSRDKLNNYDNYLKRSFSSSSLRRTRGNRLDNYMSPVSSRNESPILNPRHINQKVKYNYLNNYDKYTDNTRNNNYNTINNTRVNNINTTQINNINNTSVIKPNSIYTINNTNNNNNIINHQNNTNIFDPSANNNLQNLNLNEQEKLIIQKYSSIDLTDLSNFYPSNYNLFYLTSPDFFHVPEREIVSNKQLIYSTSKAVYIGGVNIYNQKHGKGQLDDPTKTKIGLWRNDQFTGWGRVIRKNGQVFEGKFENSNLNGKGVYSYRDVLFIGDFQNGRRQGQGILLTKYLQYKGEFNRGKIDVYGKILFINDKEGKIEYEGHFKENNIEGIGVMRWNNGNMYEGEMKNGKMNGRGKFIPFNGIPNEGIFKDNVKVSAP